MSRKSPAILFALALALVMLGASTALAAPTPTPWQRVDFTLQVEQADSLMLLYGTLPDSVRLPARAELSAPKGARVGWVGEILGGDLSKDPALSTTTRTVDGFDVYSFTLTKSRTAQLEGYLDGVVVFDGTTYSTGFEWVPTTDIGEVRLYARLRSDAKIVRTSSGAELQPGPTGYQYYGKVFKSVKAGQPLSLDFSFTRPKAAPAGTTSDGPSTPPVLLVVAAIVGASFVLLVLAMRRKRQTRTETTADDDGVETDEAGAQTPPTPARRNNRLIVALIVVGLISAIALAGIKTADTQQVVDGKITRFFGSADSCTSASFALEPGAGVDLAKSGQELLAVFEKFQGVGNVTIYLDGPRMDVAFCESSLNEATIIEALNATGLVTATSAGAAAPQ
ncbi:MAG: hypothetical protein WC971_06475 [Coriobacteriia bacterium]